MYHFVYPLVTTLADAQSVAVAALSVHCCRAQVGGTFEESYAILFDVCRVVFVVELLGSIDIARRAQQSIVRRRFRQFDINTTATSRPLDIRQLGDIEADRNCGQRTHIAPHAIDPQHHHIATSSLSTQSSITIELGSLKRLNSRASLSTSTLCMRPSFSIHTRSDEAIFASCSTVACGS